MVATGVSGQVRDPSPAWLQSHSSCSTPPSPHTSSFSSSSASDSSATITARWLLANGHLIFCLIFHYYPSANFYHDHHHHHDLQSKYNIITIPLKIKVKNMLFRCNISSPMLLSQKLDHSFEFAIFNPGFQACCYISLLVFQVIVF